jgi:hypothetical protein
VEIHYAVNLPETKLKGLTDYVYFYEIICIRKSRSSKQVSTSLYNTADKAVTVTACRETVELSDPYFVLAR